MSEKKGENVIQTNVDESEELIKQMIYKEKIEKTNRLQKALLYFFIDMVTSLIGLFFSLFVIGPRFDTELFGLGTIIIALLMVKFLPYIRTTFIILPFYIWIIYLGGMINKLPLIETMMGGFSIYMISLVYTLIIQVIVYKFIIPNISKNK